jgi:hypothetical protein
MGLSGNEVGDEGAVALAEKLPEMANLTTLDLSGAATSLTMLVLSVG